MCIRDSVEPAIDQADTCAIVRMKVCHVHVLPGAVVALRVQVGQIVGCEAMKQ